MALTQAKKEQEAKAEEQIDKSLFQAYVKNVAPSTVVTVNQR